MSFKNTPAPMFEGASSPLNDMVALFNEETVPPIFEEEVEAFKKKKLFDKIKKLCWRKQSLKVSS